MNYFCRFALLVSLPIGALHAESKTMIALSLQGTRFTAEQAFDPEQSVLAVPSTQQIFLRNDGHYRIENDTVYPGGIRFHFVEIGNSNGATVADLIGWRNGDTFDRLDAQRAQRNRADVAFLNPQWLSQQRRAENHGTSITLVDEAQRPATMAFDKEGRVISAQSANLRYEYGDHTRVGDALLPHHIRVFAGDRLLADWHVSVTMVDDNTTLFTLPNGYRDAPARGELRVTALGSQLYRIDGSPSAYHLAFIVGRDGVILFDAPFAKNEAELVKKMIDETSGGKPISHIVVSHPHRDHIAALSVFDHAGLTLITGRKGQQALTRQHGNLAAQQRIETAEPMSIDLGERQISVYPVVNSHADGMLLAYDAATQTLFQGDLFMMPESGAAVAAFDVSVELQTFLMQSRLPVSSLISVHGRVAPLSDFQQAIALRRP